jgi:DNA replication protein DnaC
LLSDNRNPRRESETARLLQQSRLPTAKTWANFDWKRLPLQVTRQLESLRDGSFLDRRENVLVFGRPGSGKSPSPRNEPSSSPYSLFSNS